MKRETVGKISTDLLKKTPDTQSPIELEREMQKEYMDNLIACINDHKKIFDKDFYVVVITKRERLMQNVFRNYFMARLSCPTPDYDQSVYKYDHKNEELSYIWTIPSRDTAYYLREHAMEVAPEENQLLNFVLEFADGTLYKLAKKLNGEALDSPLILEKK